MKKNLTNRSLSVLNLILAALFLAGCTARPQVLSTTPTSLLPTEEPVTGQGRNKPQILSAFHDREAVGRYESIEISVGLEATYENPYDARQVRLQADFKGPRGLKFSVPGFWDGKDTWKVRFTPSEQGDWSYMLVVEDTQGKSQPFKGGFSVQASDLHGWLQPGNWVDKKYSGHYLVYHDGTPFYGLGHCDALNILIDGFNVENGVALFNNMLDAGENYVVWWPLYSNSLVSGSYDDYSLPNMTVIDAVVADAQKKNIFLIFSIWDHPNLRDDTHAWGPGNWSRNGFNKLGDINSFFTGEEMWAWQENLYRYIIARWGFSPAIGMWATVVEINGTNAYSQADPWHEKVNNYFVENDPFRHPTTASQSGGTNDIAWPQGHRVMDAPQVHIYTPLNDNPVGAAEVLAKWTRTMWDEAEKPNWVGEFGVPETSYYPELYHNAIWAALAAGAAMTPAEWNSGGAWGRMTPGLLADLERLGEFVNGLPLARWDPLPLRIRISDPHVRGWGVAGEQGGLFWVQDFSMEGGSMDEVRAYLVVKSGVQAQITGIAAGAFTITPYDTQSGEFLAPFSVTCAADQACDIPLPDFQADMAFKITR